jgi:hypothetical protein
MTGPFYSNASDAPTVEPGRLPCAIGVQAGDGGHRGSEAFLYWLGGMVGLALTGLVVNGLVNAGSEIAREAAKSEAVRKAEQHAQWVRAKAVVDQMEEDRRRAEGPIDTGEPLVGSEIPEALRPEGRNVCRVQLGDDGGLLVPIPRGLESTSDVPDRDPGRPIRPGDRAVVASPDDGPGYVVLYGNLLAYVRAHWWDEPGKWEKVRERAELHELFAVARGTVVEVVAVHDGPFAPGSRRVLVKLRPGGRLAFVMESCLR